MIGINERAGERAESELMKPKSNDPLLKRLMDNPWLLLALGVVIPFVSYSIWGWIEIALIKPAALP